MQYNFIDLKGKKYNRWTFIKHIGYGKWIAKCDCGTKKIVISKNITLGKSKSCGCYRSENHPRKTHGMSETRLYSVWRNMINRCYLPCTDSYSIYGKRGIKVCTRWKNSFEKFYEDMGKTYKPELSIDRIDVNGNYSPKNCKWSNKYEQARNKRNSKLITFRNQTKTLSTWSEILGIKTSTIQTRIRAGWSIEDTLSKPINKSKRNHIFHSSAM